jgi:PBSX family phage terminase large subunit
MNTNELYHWGKWSKHTLHYLKDSNAFLNISVGSIRSGKTVSTLARWIWFLGTSPHRKFAMIGVTMGALVRNVIEPMMSMLELEGIPYDYKPAKQKLYVDGKSIALFGLDKANAEKKIQGYTSAGTLIDELTTIPQDSFEMALTRNSETGATIFATCNPSNPNHYVYKDYIIQEEIKQGSVRVFEFRLEDNPNLSPDYVGHLKTLYPKDSVFYKRYILGQWVSGRGAIYDKFDDNNIYHEQTPLNEYDYIEVGSDYGTSTTTCYEVIGIKEYPDHTEFEVIHEYGYDAKREGVTQTDAERVEDIYQLQEEYNLGKQNVFYVSHDAASLLSALQKDERITMTIDTFTPDTLECIREISSLFYQNYLRVHENCTETIQQIRGYEWDEKAAQRGEDKPVKKDDHYPDALRAPVMNHLYSGEVVFSDLVYL